jgi:hypothetical protein
LGKLPMEIFEPKWRNKFASESANITSEQEEPL